MADAAAFTPIEDHAVIGDLATAALITVDGVIDFLCLPRMDSPTVFAALLDPERGGFFRIDPCLPGARRKQSYLPDSNVLVTRMLSEAGMAEITDLMAIPAAGEPQRLIRRVRSLRGEFEWSLRCAPRFDYARRPHRVSTDGHVARFHPDHPDHPVLRISGPAKFETDGPDAVARFRVGTGETAWFVLEADGDHMPADADELSRLFDATVAFWQRWLARSSYRGRWREAVERSALALKLLCSREHGSLVAAVTFGLPEQPGGGRNWDYRYCWLRDTAFSLYALMRLGFTDEARDFARWLGERLHEHPEDDHLQIMYGVDGRRELPEKPLDSLRGWRDSRPVRIGNGAWDQLQLDIYGEVMDAVYLANKYGESSSHEQWSGILRMLRWVCQNWRQPDEGIWEVRGGRREYLHSRLMCWVAVDRGLRLAQKKSLIAPFRELAETRNAIAESIHAEFWDAEQQAFVQSKGSPALDAAVLLMPLVRFISPTDPLWLSTLDAIGKRLGHDAMVRRYDGADSPDGLEGGEGSFTACSFWYIECLARAGRVTQARALFETMLGYSNHVGLYAEELGASGEHLGNFPQALTHLALISAAYAVDRALAGGTPPPWSR